MNPMLEKLMKLKKGKKELPEAEKEGKISALQGFSDMAKEAMGKKLGGLQKVTIASDSKEGLKKGLNKAEEIVGEGNHGDVDLGDELSEPAEMPEHEEMEESAAPEELSEEEQEMSPEELDAKILKLIALKKEKEVQA